MVLGLLAADLRLRHEPLQVHNSLCPAKAIGQAWVHQARPPPGPGPRFALKGPWFLPSCETLSGSQALGSEPGESSCACLTCVYLGTEKHSFKRAS